MPDYPAIADHGLIGDLRSAALVATDGTVDWFCAPRFDSPSVFGALLDAGDGGHFRVRPAAGDVTTRQLYLPDTAVLITRFLTEAGVGEVVDFMPIEPPEAGPDERHLVRMVRCVRGEMTFDVEIAPRFDYGRERFETHLNGQGVVFQGARTVMTACLVREPGDEHNARNWLDDGGDVHARLRLTAGEMRGVVLRTGVAGPVREVPVAEVRRLFDRTVGFWKNWLGRATYAGRWREAVHRSAITLKLMTYAPTGVLIAAPTAGLPEQIGGERNWDYRYTWVRDASFSVYSLLGIGLTVGPGHEGWGSIRRLLDWVAENWSQPEEGIWETRGGRQDFTYGRLMCWVALDRGLRLAAGRRAFRQHYDTDVLDSALLRMPVVGFITPTDPMWLSTLEAMESELVTDSLVYRYDPAASPDGLRGAEGTFSLCTFAYVNALAAAGAADRARFTFEKMLTYANHLGLFSEEIGLSGDQLGNFPQAFTHLALIDAAIALDRCLDAARRP